ncbi:Uncharacterized protein Fot_01737 [Forsythia ovata]|uniref:LAGLIDADG homing endonuclease n=1 Tax=Forsythia ovata TaxID=205694 RepID=A0ABD1X7X9_9LAMI
MKSTTRELYLADESGELVRREYLTSLGVLLVNLELLACGANVLGTVGNKGWRECGARVVLDISAFLCSVVLILERNGSLSNVVGGTELVICSTSSKKTFKIVRNSIAACAVQHANYSKWRFIMANEKYQELPLLCEMAREWLPKITCNDEPDLVKMAAGVEAMEKLKILDHLLAGNGFRNQNGRRHKIC